MVEYKTSRAMENVDWKSCQRKKKRRDDIPFGGYVEYSRNKALPRHQIKKISGFASPHDSKLFADSKNSTLEGGLDTCGRKANPGRKCCRFKNIRIRVDSAQEITAS